MGWERLDVVWREEAGRRFRTLDTALLDDSLVGLRCYARYGRINEVTPFASRVAIERGAGGMTCVVTITQDAETGTTSTASGTAVCVCARATGEVYVVSGALARAVLKPGSAVARAFRDRDARGSWARRWSWGPPGCDRLEARVAIPEHSCSPGRVGDQLAAFVRHAYGTHHPLEIYGRRA